MENAIKAARQLGVEIQKTDAYKNLIAATAANDNDQDLQKLIGDFNLKRVDINQEVTKPDKDNERINKLDAELKELYNSIMENENMKAYNEAKQQVDVMMNQITTLLSMTIAGEDPLTCDPAPSGCSGSCSTCGGCH